MLKNKVVLFISSYSEIPTLLYLVDNRGKNSKIEIFVYKQKILNFLKLINEKAWNNDVEIFFLRKSNIKLNKISNYIKSFLEERNKLKYYYNKYLSKKVGYKIYFFTKNHIKYTLYFVKKLSKNNHICLIDVNTIKQNGFKLPFSKYTLGIFLNNIYNKIVFDKKIEFFSDENSIFAHASEEYINSYVDKVIDINNYIKEIDKTNNKYSNLFSDSYKKYDMIFFDQPITNYLDKSRLKIFYDNLSKIINKYFEDFVVKLHPAQESPTISEVDNIIDSYLPGEYLFNDETSVYMSYFSTVIMDEYKYNNNNSKVIMLLYLLPFEYESKKEMIKEIIDSRTDGEILFPKTFNELENILKR